MGAYFTSIEESAKNLRREYDDGILIDCLICYENVAKDLEKCHDHESIKTKTNLKTNYGLCYMLASAHSSRICLNYAIVRTCEKSWSKRTGNTDKIITKAIEGTYEGSQRWEGKYLELRKDLLHHIIHCVKVALEITHENEEALKFPVRNIEVQPIAFSVTCLKRAYGVNVLKDLLTVCTTVLNQLKDKSETELRKEKKLETSAGISYMLLKSTSSILSEDKEDFLTLPIYTMIIMCQYSWKDRNIDIHNPIFGSVEKNLDKAKNLIEHTIVCLEGALKDA